MYLVNFCGFKNRPSAEFEDSRVYEDTQVQLKDSDERDAMVHARPDS